MSDTQGHDHDGHDHTHHEEAGYGVLLGVRIFEEDGEFYAVEAEISAYVNEPNALGATLVFHSLNDMDPTAAPEDDEGYDHDHEDGWRVDIDEELTRDEEAPLRAQFHAILRQLAGLSEDQMRQYLQAARAESADDEE